VTTPLAALNLASAQAGISPAGATLIRSGENTLYRLPGGVVARVTRPGQVATASKETRVSRWLHSSGIAVVTVLDSVPDPIEAAGRAVTFWHELPEHRDGSITDVAAVLRKLHQLRPPDNIDLPPLQPFIRIEERITEAQQLLDPADQQWLHQHLKSLRHRYEELAPSFARRAVHGDAWGGNIVATASGPVVLDLERFATGPPEWDLASIAVSSLTFDDVSADDWTRFCDEYGRDVTAWSGYEVLRDARELRKVTFAFQMASQQPDLLKQAQYRLACIRGTAGSRPWRWQAVA
jgi:hypothetical protein